jgi:hypothetical protein
VVDPVAEVPQHRDRIAAEQHGPGLQAQPDVGYLEDPLDFPRRLDVCAGLQVEGRLVAVVSLPPGTRSSADSWIVPPAVMTCQESVSMYGQSGNRVATPVVRSRPAFPGNVAT